MDGFRTKTGRCVVDDGSVRLEPDLREALRGYDRTAIAVGAAALTLVAGAFLMTGSTPALVVGGILFGGLLAVGGLAANVYRERSRIGEIPFEQIQYVTVREGRLGTLSPRFIINRDSREGAAVRYVMMHSIRFSSGREEFERGKRLFREAGLELEGTLREGDEEYGDLFDDEAATDAGTEEEAEDDGPTIDDIVGDVPETETPAGIDYDRYQRVRAGEVDEELPDEFQKHFPDEDG